MSCDGGIAAEDGSEVLRFSPRIGSTRVFAFRACCALCPDGVQNAAEEGLERGKKQTKKRVWKKKQYAAVILFKITYASFVPADELRMYLFHLF